jgi:hypothetical protein
MLRTGSPTCLIPASTPVVQGDGSIELFFALMCCLLAMILFEHHRRKEELNW